jgi:hypothetical protein
LPRATQLRAVLNFEHWNFDIVSNLGLPWRDMIRKQWHLGMLLVSGDTHSVLLSQVWARDLGFRISKSK